MRFRKLRIAWSVLWGLACVLLIVLWVRSYWWHDQPLVRLSHGYALLGDSMLKRVTFYLYRFEEEPMPLSVEFTTEAIEDDVPADLWGGPAFYVATNADRAGTVRILYMPHWFPTLIFATLAILPWARQLRTRFSLRTLLIATTLAAMVLGLAVWAAAN
jgi:hypothetical protein